MSPGEITEPSIRVLSSASVATPRTRGLSDVIVSMSVTSQGKKPTTGIYGRGLCIRLTLRTGTEAAAQAGGSRQATPLAEFLKTASRRLERGHRRRDLPRRLTQAREQHVLPAKAGGRAQRHRPLDQTDGLPRTAGEDFGHRQVVQRAGVAS